MTAGTRVLIGAALLLLAVEGDAGGAPVADFHVATNGNDAWSGTLATPTTDGNDGPFATLARARDAVRKVRDADVVVRVRGGMYRLAETVVFDLSDSASATHTVIYAAHRGENPVFSSAFPLAGWRKLQQAPEALPLAAHGKVWVASVDGHPAMTSSPDGGSPRFFTLFGSGRRLPRARGKGFSQTNQTPRGSQDHTTVRFPPGAVRRYADLQDAELVVIPMHYWVVNILPIASIDERTLTITTARAGTYPLGKNGMTDRPTAWVENVLEVLDEPGEWVLDSAAKLVYYWPPDGRPGDDISAPALTELVRVEGKVDGAGAADQPVEGLVFRGLTFTGGDRLPWCGRTGWGLQHDWELFDKPTALVRLRGAAGCRIEDCTFTDSGHAAVRLDLHCRGNTVVGNCIRDIGGVGVLLAGYGPGTKDVNKGNAVCNNHIHHVGQVYWGSAAIFAWQSGENRIAHNLIHHVPYNGINVTGRIIRGQPGPGECTRTIRWNEVPSEYARLSWRHREPYLHSRSNTVEFNNIINNVVADLRPDQRHRGYIVFPYGSVKGSVIERNILLAMRKEQRPYWENTRAGFRGGPTLLRDTAADRNLYHCTLDAAWGQTHIDRERLLGQRITTRIHPAGGVLRRPLEVTILCDADNAAIHFTMDGSEPTHVSPRYRGPFVLAEPALVRARTLADGAMDLAGARAEFTAPPRPVSEDFEDASVGSAAPGSETSEDARLRQFKARVTDELASSGK